MENENNLKELINIHKKIPIKVDLPGNQSENSLFVTIQNGIEKEHSVLLYVKVNNLEKFNYLTDKIINYFIKTSLKRQLQFFLIEKDIELSFI